MRVCLIIGLVFLTSCSRADRPPQSELITQDGIEILVNYRPVRGTVPGEIVPAEDLLIVDDTAPDMPIEAAIGGIRSIRAGPNGEIIILDGRLFDLKVFDELGDFIRRFGRPGSGPGEFEQVSWMPVIDRNRITVLDQFPWLLKFFDLAGNYIEQFALPSSSLAVAPDPDGGYFVARSIRHGGREEWTSTYYLQRIDGNGDRRPFTISGSDQDTLVIARTSSTGDEKYPQHYPNRPVLPSPTGEVYAHGNNYTIYRIDSSGFVSGFRRFTDSIRFPAWWLAAERQRYIESGREPPARVGYREAPNQVTVDEHGHFWIAPFVGAEVQLAASREEFDGFRLTTLEEFDATGRWLRQVLIELPPPASGFFVMDAANGYLYGILVGTEMESSRAARIRRPD